MACCLPVVKWLQLHAHCMGLLHACRVGLPIVLHNTWFKLYMIHTCSSTSRARASAVVSVHALMGLLGPSAAPSVPLSAPSLRYQGAGAIWDIWSRSSLQPLDQYLAAHAAQFIHRGHPVAASGLAAHSPVLSQAFMLGQTHREAFLQWLQQQQGQQQGQPQERQQQEPGAAAAAQPGAAMQHGSGSGRRSGQRRECTAGEAELWHFEQFEGEAVFIPGGCGHQVRNLKSCCKVRLQVRNAVLVSAGSHCCCTAATLQLFSSRCVLL